jgi:signal transduction histidine kinase
MERALDDHELHLLNAKLGKAQSRAALMLQAIRTASSSLDLEKVLGRIAEMMALATGVHHCGIYLLDPEQDTLVYHAGTGDMAPAQFIAVRRYRLDPARFALLFEALQRREPVVSLDLQAEKDANHEMIKMLDLRSMLAVPLTVRDHVLGMALICTMGHCHNFSAEEVELAWGVANAVALAVRNAQAYEEVRQRLAETESLQRVATGLLRGITLPEILHIVCTEAQHLTGATGSAVLKAEGDGWLRIIHSTGIPLSPHERIPADATLASLAVERGVPVLSNDPVAQLPAAGRSLDITSLLAAPMRVGSATIGVLDVLNKPGGFNRDDIRIISLFADQAALNIEHTRLLEQAEQFVIVQERQRLARELHDNVTQSLYSVTLYADAAGMALTAGKPQVAMNNLHELRETAQAAMRDMRLLIFELHPPMLQNEGLVAALQSRLQAVETRAGLQTDLQVQGERRLALDIEQELYGIAQEALNNVVKHARARNVKVKVEYGVDAVYMQVTDDGVGFDPPAAQQKGGMGLRNIEERATRIGGTLELFSEPGRGTTVKVMVKTQVV